MPVIIQPITGLDFAQDNIAAGQAEAAMPRAGSPVTDIPMPVGGVCLFLSVSLSALKTAGVLRFSVAINGGSLVENYDFPNATSESTFRILDAAARFQAGQRLEVTLLSDGALLPAGTLDVAATLLVALDRGVSTDHDGI